MQQMKNVANLIFIHSMMVLNSSSVQASCWEEGSRAKKTWSCPHGAFWFELLQHCWEDGQEAKNHLNHNCKHYKEVRG